MRWLKNIIVRRQSKQRAGKYTELSKSEKSKVLHDEAGRFLKKYGEVIKALSNE